MRTTSLRRLLAAGLGCVALGAAAVAGAVPAGAANTGTGAARPGPHLTTGQRQCLAERGVTRPIRPLTPQKIATIKAAAKACDVKVPAALKRRWANRRAHRIHLTAEQRQCLSGHGVTRPVRPLTTEKVATIKSAAQACGIRLPDAFGRRVWLSDAQVQCLSQHGVTFPVRPLTRDKVATLRAAAQACGVHRPDRSAATT